MTARLMPPLLRWSNRCISHGACTWGPTLARTCSGLCHGCFLGRATLFTPRGSEKIWRAPVKLHLSLKILAHSLGSILGRGSAPQYIWGLQNPGLRWNISTSTLPILPAPTLPILPDRPPIAAISRLYHPLSRSFGHGATEGLGPPTLRPRLRDVEVVPFQACERLIPGKESGGCAPVEPEDFLARGRYTLPARRILWVPSSLRMQGYLGVWL